MSEIMEPGSVNWIDLTVPNAERVRDFYQAVVGWDVAPISMDEGAYQDFSMVTRGQGKNTAGICHNRGINEGIPPVWMIYITVENLPASLKACEERGGTVLRPAQNIGTQATYAIIRDPAGAVCALFEPTGQDDD